MWLRVIVVALTLFCISCSNIRNEQVTKSNVDTVGRDVANSKLPDADKTAFIAAVLRSAMGAGSSIDGKTVGQIIDQEKQDEATQAAREQAQAALDAQAKTRADAAERAMASAVILSVYKINYVSMDPNWFETGGASEDQVKFYFNGSNQSTKTVRAFQGTMTIEDTLGNKVQDLQLKFTPNNDIPPHVTFDTAQTFDATGFGSDLTSLKTTPLSRLKLIWKPSKIVFSDGSSMTADATGGVEESPTP